MKVEVRYWSWFRDLTHVDHEFFDLPEASTLGDLLGLIRQKHPRLADLRRSTLVAVGLEYGDDTQPLHDSDQVSLFPPVQGG